MSKEYEEQEKLETKDENKVEKKGENGGREDDGKATQDKDRMARRRSAGEAREQGTRRFQLKRVDLSQGVKAKEDG